MSAPRLCGGHNRAGKPCGNVAGKGTNHPGWGNCKHHGGATPNGVKSAQARHAAAEVATYGLPREIDPHSALLEELHRTAGHVAWLGQKIAAFETDSQMKQYAKAGTFESSVDGEERAVVYERPAIWVELYHRERKHFAEIAKTCVAVGIEERRVHLAEQQGQLIAEVLRGVLTEAGIIDRPDIAGIVRRHLTLVAG